METEPSKVVTTSGNRAGKTLTSECWEADESMRRMQRLLERGWKLVINDNRTVALVRSHGDDEVACSSFQCKLITVKGKTVTVDS